MRYILSEYKSPVGTLFLVSDAKSLHGIFFKKSFSSFKEKFPGIVKAENPLTIKTKLQLDEYFAGKRRKFALPIKFTGTDFQRKAWNALRKIPYGKTISYSDQAKSIRHPKAVRAVGTSNGKNPLSIVIPCHRVIASAGKLGGYGGGLKTKRYLLDLECRR